MAQSKKSTKTKRGVWFVKKRGSYIPVSLTGWLTYIPFFFFLLLSLLAVLQNTNNTFGALFDVFPYWVSAAVIMHWLASYKS